MFIEAVQPSHPKSKLINLIYFFRPLSSMPAIPAVLETKGKRDGVEQSKCTLYTSSAQGSHINDNNTPKNTELVLPGINYPLIV